MFRSRNFYDCKRLNNLNIQKYVLSKDLDYDTIELKSAYTLPMTPFLQDHFGKKYDCSLISILTCLYYWLSKERTPEELYIEIEKNAENCFYDGNNFGTIPFFIKTIYQECVNNFKLDFKVHSHYMKGLGFNAGLIKDLIKSYNIPIILSLSNDGRDYYTKHSLVVIGYKEFLLKGKGVKDKIETVFCVYDHWSATLSYVDLDRVSLFSSICY